MRGRAALCICAAALATAAAAAEGVPAREAVLVPRIGETVQAFEARRQGLAPPIPAAQASLAAGRNGHFVAEATINGRKVQALVDTGASFVALSQGEAERLGVKVGRADFTYRMSTANGVVMAAPVRLAEVRVGAVVLTDVAAVVHGEGGPPIALLGMSFLGRLRGFETSGGRLLLRQ